MILIAFTNCIIHIYKKRKALKYIYLLVLLSFSMTSSSQDDCIELFCDDGSFVNQHIQNIKAEIAIFGDIGFCNSGAMQQCFYQGQAVYTVLESPFVCDLPTRVVDCSGNTLFTFGGFCFPGPCPGQDQANMLEGCITLFSTFDSDNIFCTSEQLACAEPSCDAFDEIKANLLDPNLNASDPISGCVPSQTLSQCDYRGLTVVVQSPGACLLADEPSTVYDCSGDFLFQFGGFCISIDGSPCPGDIEAQFISNCQVIFSVQEGDIIDCADEVEMNAIPTMGEWALISLSLIFMIFGIVSIKHSRRVHT